MTRPALALGIAGAATLALIHLSAPPPVIARLAVCGGALGAAAWVDLVERRVPNRLVLPATAACATLSAAAGLSSRALPALGIVAILLAVSVMAPPALGMGDVKLALLITVGLDGKAVLALVAGLALAALAGLTLIARHGRLSGRRTLPLAPFFAVAATLVSL
jgi:leader peptidase (prepilin peptidase)/N-methyltransferase